jgi:hypothetical protein
MAIGAGIGAQFGIVNEATFNTYVAPTKFYEFNSESIQYEKNTAVGMGLRAGGQVARSQRRVVTTFGAGGDLVIDMPTRGLGYLLSHAMGGTAPTGTLVSTGTYTYTFTLGDVFGRSFTAQAGVPQYGGTVLAKTMTGCKVAGFEIGVDNGGIATGKFTIDAANLVTTQSLATASYALNGGIFHFAQGALTVDAGGVTNVKDFTLTVDNNLKTDRYALGGLGAKSEQTIGGFRKVSGKMTAEFTDAVLMNKFLTDSSAALVLTFTGNLIQGTYYDKLVITVPAVKLNGETPAVAGDGPVDLSLDWEAYDDGTNQPLTILHQTSEATL